MFCERCGCTLNNDAKFCPRCGSPVSANMDGQKAFETVKAKDIDEVDIMPKNSMINEPPNGLKGSSAIHRGKLNPEEFFC